MTTMTGPSGQVLVTGATGLVGQALVRHLVDQGHGVIVLSRDAPGARHRFERREVVCVQDLDELANDVAIDAVVHLAGARVLDRRWTPARRQLLADSRLAIAERLRKLIERLDRKPRVLVSASAVSVYGPSHDALWTESDEPAHGGFGSELCVRIERDAGRARDLGVRVVALRLGIVLAREGGALPPMALAARFGLAPTLGSGQQPVAWIHVQDAVRLIAWLLESSTLDGAVNAVAPEVPDQAGFVAALAAHFGRRARWRVPGAVLRLAMGERSSLLLEGQRAVPAAALDAGFAFAHPTLSSAMDDLWPDARGASRDVGQRPPTA